MIHQYHGRHEFFKCVYESNDHPIKSKLIRNEKLYESRKNFFEQNNFKYPRLLHLYWDGSPLSFLNYLTVISFLEYHKNWKINLFMPKKRTDIISWITNEQKNLYTGKCYLEKLKQIKNVNVQIVDLDKIGVDNQISEVVKSDFF